MGMAPLIVVATPCFGGLVTQTYMLSVLKLMQHAAQGGYRVALSLLGHDALIARARSTLVGAFLDNPAATHLLFIDADIGFEPEQVDRLLRFDQDFTAALYPYKAIDWDKIPERCTMAGETLRQAGTGYVGTFCPPQDRKVQDGFATALYAGGGFQLIRRAAIERMITAHPELRYTGLNAVSRAEPPPSRLYALFDSIIDPDTGAYLSEDYAFCRRWRSLGGEIWLDTTSRLIHVGAHEFAGDHAVRFASLTM
jgi:hypothetical protein